MFGSMISQEMAFFDKNKTGELINRLSADTSVVGNSLTMNISDGLRSVAQAVGGITMMVSYYCSYITHHQWHSQALIPNLGNLKFFFLRKYAGFAQQNFAEIKGWPPKQKAWLCLCTSYNDTTHIFDLCHHLILAVVYF